MGRPPIGKTAMSATERWRRHRARKATSDADVTLRIELGRTRERLEMISARTNEIIDGSMAELASVNTTAGMAPAERGRSVMTALDKKYAAPVPSKLQDWTRYLETDRTLNDMVEEIIRSLVEESQEFRTYLNAVWDSEAIEGSLAMDNTMAAIMIRDTGKKTGSEVAKKKLDTIVKSMNIVLRRYHESRKERRGKIGGENVSSENNE